MGIIGVDVRGVWRASAVWVAAEKRSGVGVGICDGRLQASAAINKALPAIRIHFGRLMSKAPAIRIKVVIL